GLNDPRRPPGVFLMVGTSGVGKTETALALADELYGGPQNLTVINMSEFKEEHKVSLLMGSPPGYVGYGEGGVLTEAVRRRPYGVLLLDEMDKAHPGVQDIFYQLFDKGTLKDGEGRDIDFKNTTIMMTANTGTETLAGLAEDPETMPEGEALAEVLKPELLSQFKPAFLGRVAIAPFLPLDSAALGKILDLQIARIADRVKEAYGTDLALTPDAHDALVSRCISSDTGARALESMLSSSVLSELSLFFLEAVARDRIPRRIDIDMDDDGGVTVVAVSARKKAKR
ncbi:MAG: AAA family ATPase, partial [Pseudomonadota bacterium]